MEMEGGRWTGTEEEFHWLSDLREEEEKKG